MKCILYRTVRQEDVSLMINQTVEMESFVRDGVGYCEARYLTPRNSAPNQVTSRAAMSLFRMKRFNCRLERRRSAPTKTRRFFFVGSGSYPPRSQLLQFQHKQRPLAVTPNVWRRNMIHPSTKHLVPRHTLTTWKSDGKSPLLEFSLARYALITCR